jgi:hypothetical protein
MPRLSVVFIRLGLVHLAIGFTLGGLLLANKGQPLHPATWSLLPAHIEFLLSGWTLQLTMGVAFWILPRFSRAPRRGNERLAWTALALVNLGVLLAGVGPLLSASPWLVLGGRLAQAAAALLFVLHAWPRVKPLGA